MGARRRSGCARCRGAVRGASLTRARAALLLKENEEAVKALTPEQIATIREAFDKFDTDSMGCIYAKSLGPVRGVPWVCALAPDPHAAARVPRCAAPPSSG